MGFFVVNLYGLAEQLCSHMDGIQGVSYSPT